MNGIARLWKLGMIASIVSMYGIGGNVPPFPGHVSSVATFAQEPPPEGDHPPSTVSGGSRGETCANDEKTAVGLTPLMRKLPDRPSNYGRTVSASPEFFIYIPKTIAREAEFILKDENNVEIYTTTFKISGEAGTLIVELPESIALEINRYYYWSLALNCNSTEEMEFVETDNSNFLEQLIIDGWTRRFEVNPALATQLENADRLTQFNLYAEAGIWHDAIAIVAQLRQDKPDDEMVAQEWKTLLKSIVAQVAEERGIHPLESAQIEELLESPIQHFLLPENPEISSNALPY